MTNPYAPPQAIVEDIVDPFDKIVLADRGTRLGAAILDGFIFAGLVYLPLMLSLGLNSAVGQDGSDAIVIIGSALAMMGFVVWLGLTVRYVLRNGQSIAKKIAKIKVVRRDGSPVNLGRIFWMRNVANGILSFIPLYGLIEILFIFSESRQCIHDKLADTIVVKE
jgi:uncharacterized RDD family membrane protein YckC